MSNYYLYILCSQVKETYYIGVSKDPEKRCFFHNHDTKGYTQKYRLWIVVFIKEFPTKKEALVAERKVKSWKSKKMIRLLVERAINIADYLP